MKQKADDEQKLLLAEADKQIRRRIVQMSLEEREQEERQYVYEFIKNMIETRFIEFEDGRADSLSHENKLQLMAQKLKNIFEKIQMTMAIYRGR